MRQYLYRLATDKENGQGARVIKPILILLSFIYGGIIRCVILLRRSFASKFSCKIISVGNITLGGTGKTTLVEYLARYLLDKGRRVVIVSRGYKRKLKSKYAALGDEPSMLIKNLGNVAVIVNPNRVRAIKEAIQRYGADTVILDDGFQQWGIKKDLEIVTIDATNPFGNRHMLPRGILREPLSSLARADLFMLTKSNLAASLQETKAELSRLNLKAKVIESIHQPEAFYGIHDSKKLIPLDHFKGKSVMIFSGIGDPDSFESLVKSLGSHVLSSIKFPDHHSYSQKEISSIVSAAQEKKCVAIMTTEKDAARLLGKRHVPYDIPIIVLRIRLGIKTEKELHDRLYKLYSV